MKKHTQKQSRQLQIVVGLHLNLLTLARSLRLHLNFNTLTLSSGAQRSLHQERTALESGDML